jgi:hypothetical protein
MPENPVSYEQTRVMREAVEMATRLIQGGKERRQEIATIIFGIHDHKKHDASSLANLAVKAVAEADGKKG